MTRERRLLQAVVALLCMIPLSTASVGILRGAEWLAQDAVRPDLDSHFRYLSGIFLGMALGFASCIPVIERQGARFRLLGMMVVIGGLARAWSLIEVGPPSTAHLVGLCVELGAVPLVLLWQASLQRRWQRG